MSRCLMVQGTTSDAGKSLLVTALGRWLHRQGVRVAPFKPQNMALNSAVTDDGGEIGRAQAVQAAACGIAPHTDMNPVLLKPDTDTRAQVIVQGHPLDPMEAADYHAYKRIARQAVLESFERLSAEYDVVLVEGAGSPAEINLREGDIANMGFAEAVDCPVILIADIDRGGVFAHIVGTLALLSASERARVAGFVINRFRGDISLLQPGLDWLERETGKPALGVLPYLYGLAIDAEDALPEQDHAPAGMAEALRVVVPVTPRLANHTDFDPLRRHPRVDFRYWRLGQPIPPADLIVLGGSKAVRADLAFLRTHGWERAIRRHLRYGGKVLGICGGFQMLGQRLLDTDGLEGAPGADNGFGWLDVWSEMPGSTSGGVSGNVRKHLANVTGELSWGGAVRGYEIHMGVTRAGGPTPGPARTSAAHQQGAAVMPFAILSDGREDGAISPDGQVAGTYLHGLFDEPTARASVLAWAGLAEGDADLAGETRAESLDRLADCVAENLSGEWLARQFDLNID